jgi:hypothetical protein
MFRILIVSIFYFCSLLTGVADIPVNKESGFTYSLKENGNGSVRYLTPEYSFQSVIDADGNTYKRPTLLNASQVSDPGQPDLPSSSTFIAIDPTKTYSVNVNIVSSQFIDDIEILPKNSWENDAEISFSKGEIYNSEGFYPESIASISEPMVMRELTIVSLTVSPFRYYPQQKRLEEFTEIEIELVETGESDNTTFRPATRSRAFEPLYESLITNYASLDRDDIPYQRPSILYVLPSNIGNLLGTVNVLMDWKRRVGYEVNYISSSNIVNNSNDLKNYIETAYQAWENPPEYVTIIADAEGSYDVPTHFENWSGYNGEGDHPYSTLVGNDFLPEVFLGRLSFDSQSHLQTIISKTLNYESSPYMGENWFQRACLVGDPSTSGISCVITNDNIKEVLQLHGFNDIRTVYSGSFPSQMTNNLSDGLGFFNYRGYYGVSGFNSSNVNSTNNGFMLPIVTVITCGTGSFGSDECLSEAFLRAGTASNPKGSVASIGTATLGTHTMFNNMVDMGFYYGALVENINSVGGALMAGKLWLSRAYPTNPNNYVSTFTHWNNLMGDASLQMWTAYPEMLNVTHVYSVTKGTNFIDISLTNSGGSPVEEAWVTIYKEGDVLESGYSDNNGFVRIAVPTTEVGEILVTATKKNHYPYKSSFQIYDPGPSVNVYSDYITINDNGSGTSSGNGDGVINAGEVIDLVIAVSNYGSEGAIGIVGTLTSENSIVSIINDSFSYGDLGSGDIINNASSPFTFSVNDDVHHGAEVKLLLNLSNESGYSSVGYVGLIVAGKNLYAYGVDIEGSSQDVLTSGQTSTVHIELHNSGSTSALNISGQITSASTAIEILDNTGTWSSVYPGGFSSSSGNGNSFIISAVEDVIPGTVAHLILSVNTEDGYTNSSVIPIQIGIPTVMDPTGPDSHGYYIYDSGDIDYLLAPVYNWVEIDSRYGGSGTYLSSLDDNGDNDDDVETVDLPFDFRFYGQVYDKVSICSNGWIAFGDTDMSSFRNYPIPGAGGPGKMVAVFWDDLKLTNSGRVYTWYDSNDKVFIVQWSRVRTYQNNSTETFQIILRDPNYFMTPTNDGEMLIQYMDFTNNTTGSYSWSQIHGNYCTVGIEDHTMTQGLQYTFNNTYADAAMQLSNETAILITTRGSEMRLDGDLNTDGMVDVNDLLILIDHIVADQNHFNPFLADINSDGMVNILDMVRLIQMVMGYN